MAQIAWAPLPSDGITHGWRVMPCRAVVENINEKNEGATNQNYLSLMANVGIIPYEKKGDVGNKKPDDLAKCKIVRRGNLVINSMNYSIGSYGMSRYNGVCSPVYIVLRIREEVALPRFALRVFENRAFQTYVASLGNGILEHRAAIGWDDIKGIKILVPPEDEQTSILNFIDHETGKVSRLMTLRRRQMELLREQRAALIQQCVTLGLNRNASMKDSGVEWLGPIPNHWDVKEIRHLVPRDRQVMYGIVLPGPNVDEGVPIVKAGNCEPGRLLIEIMHRTTFEIEAGYVRSRLRAGDLVYAIRGSFGQAEIVPPELEGANLTQDAARIAPEAEIYNRWLWYAVRSHAFFALMDSVAVGATIRGVNIRDLKRGKLPIPPLSEQREIAAFLDEEGDKTERLLSAYTRQLELLTEYRAALIHECVTGQRALPVSPSNETP